MSEMLPFFDDDHRQWRARAQSWCAANGAAIGEPGGALEASARNIVRLLGAGGLLGATVPRTYGGVRERVSARDLCLIRESLGRFSALADTLFAVQALGGQPIVYAGTPMQKQRYLPNVARGAAIAAFALTEPEAGSDAARLQTSARRVDGGYALNGVKRLISNAGIADFYVVFAAGEGENGHRISAFIVDAGTPGLTLAEKTRLMAPHPIGAIAFNDCRIDANALLGAEGDGLKIAFATLDLLRCSVGAAAVGMAQRALDEALGYSKARTQFGRTIGEFQGIQFKLAEMAAELEAARLLVCQAAWSLDCGGDGAKRQSSIAKLYATEAAQRIIDQALQIHGGAGVVAGHIMERLYREIRALRIYEGTSEIQKLIIARELLKSGGGAP